MLDHAQSALYVQGTLSEGEGLVQLAFWYQSNASRTFES
jgi:hypothetical protein